MQKLKEIIINTDNMEKPIADNTLFENRRMLYSANECELSICIMAYNRLEKTKDCVESVLKYTKDIDYILVLADNGSTDGTYEYFQSVEYEKKMLIKITKNITGPYGSNQILRYIRTKYYALLGNDTIMTPNWMNNMLKCIKSDDRIGMVAPLSTNTDIEQTPNLPQWENLDELQQLALEYNHSDPSKWEECLRLIPIVALYRTEVFDIAGKYDPGFFHDFTEDDHNLRIRRCGYRIILCRDTFVHHNHIMAERTDMDIRTRASNSGRNSYQLKYDGIDAWADINNHIPYVKHILETPENDIRILGIDPKCGTPILDAVSRYRQLGTTNIERCAYTTNVKYYTDLKSICRQTVHDRIENIKLYFQAEEFDCIVMDTPINMYSEPLKRMEDILSLLKQGGYFLMPLRNNYDIKAFLNLFDLMDLIEWDLPVQLHYSLVFKKLHELNVKNIKTDFSLHMLPMDFAEQIRSHYFAARLTENVNESFDKLLIENYWFIVRK